MTKCPDCYTLKGELHLSGCDVARCKWCGGQLLSCDCEQEFITTWDGEWPGLAECREFNLWCKRNENGPGYVKCDKDDPNAKEDLNKLHENDYHWNKDKERWEEHDG